MAAGLSLRRSSASSTLHRAGSGDAARRESGRGHRSALSRLRRVARRRRRSSAATPTPSCATATRRFRPMLAAIERREVAHQLRNLRLQGRRDRRSLRRRAGARGRARRHRADHPRSDRIAAEAGESRSAREGRREAGVVQHARFLHASKKPTTAPTARRWSSTATSRSPAAWASPITGSATRRTRSTGATRISRSPVPRCARSRRRSTRTGSNPAAGRRRRSIRSCRRGRPAPRSIVVWSNPMAGASNIKLLYLLAIGAARKTIDIQSPYITLDRRSTRGASTRRASAACGCAC